MGCSPGEGTRPAAGILDLASGNRPESRLVTSSHPASNLKLKTSTFAPARRSLAPPLEPMESPKCQGPLRWGECPTSRSGAPSFKMQPGKGC